MKSLWLAILALVCCASCAGCALPRVAGTSDVELTYVLGDGAPRAGDVRALVRQRLGAVGIGADVTETEGELHVVVDEHLAPRVDALLTWSGTLLLLEPDPSYVVVPGPTGPGGLVAREDPAPGGGIEHGWQGSRADVARAVQTWPVDARHRLVAEPIWSTARGGQPPLWRTRAVIREPMGELGDGTLVGWGEGPTLRLRAAPGTPAERVLRAARVRAGAAHDDASTVVSRELLVRGRASLGHATLTADSAILAFGDGIEAYARAGDERQLLTTPRLPELRRQGAVGLPPNAWLGAACFVVPVLLSLAWIVFVRRFDRAHPEPMWLVLVTFLFGAASTLLAGALEVGLASLTPWLDPRVASMGGLPYALPLSFLVFAVVIGLSEEGSKLLGTTFAMRRREFDEPIDGIVYGIASSLGFAAAENFRYFALLRLSATVVVARTFMSVPAHMFFGAIWGYALGKRLVDPRMRVAVFVGVAAAMHGLFDALLAAEGLALFAVALNFVLASVFVLLVRRALRHGVVEEAMLGIRPEDRVLVRVGRPAAFVLSSVALHALALGIFVLGASYQLSKNRPGALFVLGSSAMLALLGLAAYGVSATVPLDVAIDDYGVTFAGAARPWRRIRGFEARGDHLVLDCDSGPIRLGPGSPAAVLRVARELSRRRL